MGLQCIFHGRDSALCRINWQGLLGQDTELHIGLFLQFSRLPFDNKNAKVSKLCLYLATSRLSILRHIFMI